MAFKCNKQCLYQNFRPICYLIARARAVADPGFLEGGGASLDRGCQFGRGRQVKWHSRLWAEIKKIGLA